MTCGRLAIGFQLPLFRAQRRYMGIVRLSGPTAALWTTITATVGTASIMTHTVTMNHTREADFQDGHLQSFPHYGWTKLARAETRLRVTGIVAHWIALARLGLTCWRLTLGAQLPNSLRNAANWAKCNYRGRMPPSGQTLLRLCTMRILWRLRLL